MKSWTAFMVTAVFVIVPFPAQGEGGKECGRLETRVTGAGERYAAYAEVEGPAAFEEIPCAVAWRNTELCAMELTEFDITARVTDYESGEELVMAEAFFAVPGKDGKGGKVVAFATRDGARKHVDKAGGTVVDYTGLTELF